MNWLFLWMVKRFVILLSLKKGEEPQTPSTRQAWPLQEKPWLGGCSSKATREQLSSSSGRERPFPWQEFL